MIITKGGMTLEIEDERDNDGSPCVALFLSGDGDGFRRGGEYLSIRLTADEAATLAGELALLVNQIRKGKG